jgi:UTP-glucose-1-phosphate uridylyltransferase
MVFQIEIFVGEEPFFELLGDDLMKYTVPLTRQWFIDYQITQAFLITVMKCFINMVFIYIVIEPDNKLISKKSISHL